MHSIRCLQYEILQRNSEANSGSLINNDFGSKKDRNHAYDSEQQTHHSKFPFIDSGVD